MRVSVSGDIGDRDVENEAAQGSDPGPEACLVALLGERLNCGPLLGRQRLEDSLRP